MEPTEAERLLRNLDRRVERIEQFLPTRAGSDELAHLATSDELTVASKTLGDRITEETEVSRRRFDAIDARIDEHGRRFDAIDARLEEHGRRFDAIDARLEEHGRRFDEMDARIREEGARTRGHFDVVAERMHDELRLIAEGHSTQERRTTGIETRLNGHDTRLNKLETAALAAKRSKKR